MPQPGSASPHHKRQRVSTRSTDLRAPSYDNHFDQLSTAIDTAVIAIAAAPTTPDRVEASTRQGHEAYSKGAPRIRQETATKINDWRQKWELKEDEVFLVSMLITEEAAHPSHYEESSSALNKNLALNRTMDGAIESALTELVDHDILESLVADQLEWSKEDMATLGPELNFHAFVHIADADSGGIDFTFGDDVPYEPGTKYELRIDTISIGK